MAYMSQEKKATIAAALKRVVPKTWKYSLAVEHHSTIVMTIAAAPVDLVAEFERVQTRVRPPDRSLEADNGPRRCLDVYTPRIEQYFDESLPLFKQIAAALHEGNHDRSDMQSDYFDVGWYVDLKIGKWDKPFVCVRVEA